MTTHGQPAVGHNGNSRSAGPPADELALALRRLRTALATTAYTLALPGVEQARRTGAAVMAQLDDYLLPKLAQMDAPLLAVVGGSTGTGKSTLVNSLVRAPVSAAGVLRPTTRAPVLAAHPIDIPWFRQGNLLPELARTTRTSTDPYTLRLVTAPALVPGLALLDAPDIDSVVASNRELAAQLLSASDLWLFVTSAARYADAMPWELLRTAAYRGTPVALILDRVPPESAEEVVGHLTELLGIHQFTGVPLFVLPETARDGQGLLPETVVASIRQWLFGIAAAPATRWAVVRQAMGGALATIEPIVAVLVEAAEEQATATGVLTDRVTAAYRAAGREIERGLRDGALLRGEVLARWREYAETGELARTLDAHAGRALSRVVAAISGPQAPGERLRSALESSLVAQVQAAAAESAEQAYAGWQAHPGGVPLLRAELAHPSGELAQRAEELVRDWRHGVLELVRGETDGVRSATHSATYAEEATALLIMIGVLAPASAEPAPGNRPETGPGDALGDLLGGEPLLGLVGRARDDLLGRVNALLDVEAGRYLVLLPSADDEVPRSLKLREAAERVERARLRVALTSGEVGY